MLTRIFRSALLSLAFFAHPSSTAAPANAPSCGEGDGLECLSPSLIAPLQAVAGSSSVQGALARRCAHRASFSFGVGELKLLPISAEKAQKDEASTRGDLANNVRAVNTSRTEQGLNQAGSRPPKILRGEIEKRNRKQKVYSAAIDESPKLEGSTGWELILHGDVKLSPALLQKFRNSNVFSDVGEHPRHLKLYIGNVLTDCSENMTIDLALGRLEITPGAIVYIRASQTGTAIFNFHDDHRDSVKLKVGKTTMYIPPGRMVLLSEHKSRDFDDLNPCAGVWYKTVCEKKLTENEKSLSGQTRIFMTQFSLLSAVGVMPSVKTLAALRKARGEKIAKTFAAVYLITRDRASFRPKGHS